MWYSEGLDHSDNSSRSLLSGVIQILSRSVGASSLSSFFDFSGAAAGFFFNFSGIFLATGLGSALGLRICLFCVFPHPLPVQILNSSGADLFDLSFALFDLPFAALDSVDEWLATNFKLTQHEKYNHETKKGTIKIRVYIYLN